MFDPIGNKSVDQNETITMTVGNTNGATVLDTIGDRSIDESTPLTFAESAIVHGEQE